MVKVGRAVLKYNSARGLSNKIRQEILLMKVDNKLLFPSVCIDRQVFIKEG